MRPGRVGKGLGLLQGEAGTARVVVGVFQTEEACPGVKDSVGKDRSLHLSRRHSTQLTLNGPGREPTKSREESTLVVVDMGQFFENDGLPPLGVGKDRHHVGHCRAENQHGRFFSEQLRGLLLQGDYGGVVPIVVVSYFGVGHGPSHGLRWLRYRVASEVDHRSL